MSDRKVYVLWESINYKKEDVDILGIYTSRKKAERVGRDAFKLKMVGAATVFKKRGDAPFPLSGCNDDVIFSYWVHEKALQE